ncbi:MAG: pentapeptide repeat-containing protein [Caulobacter sp.]
MAISDEWWRGWWEADYSWDGLARQKWDGWVRPADGGPCRRKEDGVEGEPATLQDHFRDWLGGEPELFESPDGSVRFTRLHLPLAWRDGTSTGKADWGKAERGRLMAMVRRLNEMALAQEPPSPARLNGSVLLDFDVNDLGHPADPRKDGRIPVALSLERAAFVGNVWFNNAAFSGAAIFNNAAFSGAAKFNSAVFSGFARFGSATFSGDARFNNAAFSGGANFMGAAFSGNAWFNSASFSGDAWFDSADFSGDAWFDSAAFSGDATFDIAAFSGNAAFDSADFSRDATFDGAAFSRNARFNNAAFSGKARFNRAAFSGDARFESAAFSGDARFDRAVFSGNAWFDRAAFSGNARFESAAFSRNARFNSAAFSRDAWFDSAAFSGNARFNSAAFSGNARFSSAAFSGSARFNSAAFFSNANLSGVSEPTDRKEERQAVRIPAEGGENQFEIITPAGPLPRASRSFQTLDFSGVAVLGDADLSNRDVLTGAKFKSTMFRGRALFHGSRLHQGVLLDHKQFDTVLSDEPSTTGLESHRTALKGAVCVGAARLIDGWQRTERTRRARAVQWAEVREGIANDRLGLVVKAGAPRSGILPEGIYGIAKVLEDNWPAILAALEEDRLKNRPPKGDERDLWLRNVEADFRTLKLAMEDKRERISEGEFFRLELEARRRRGDIPSWERWASGAYRLLANYGNSLRRPFVGLAILWAASGLVFLGLGEGLDRLAPIVTTSHAQISADCQRMIVENQIGAGASAALSEACAASLGPEGAAKASLATPAVRASDDLRWARLEDMASAYTFAWNNIFRPLSALSAEGVAPYEPSWASAVLYGYGPGWGLLVRFLATVQSLIAIVIIFLLALAIRRRFQIS